MNGLEKIIFPERKKCRIDDKIYDEMGLTNIVTNNKKNGIEIGH